MKRNKTNLITTIILLMCFTLLSILSCTTDDTINNDIESIKYGTSFGECYGYCKNEIVITSSEVTLTKEGWVETADLPIISYKEEIENMYLQELFEKVNFDDFLNLNEVIGCPDCTDGGAEFIEITTKNETHKVTFEYLTDEIPELEEILESLRALNSSLQKDAYLVIDNDTYNATSTDNYTITDVSLNNDVLKLSISSSGCSGNSWLLNLIDSEAILESKPIQRKLKVNLVNEELCEALFTKEYQIDISALQVADENEILLNIEGWSESILYEY